MKVLVACEYSGIVRSAFEAKGHYAVSCDLLPTEIKGNHYQRDVRDILKDEWDLMIAHPPCTYLCVSGNKWFSPKYKHFYPNRDEDRKEAIEFFMELVNANIPKICIENPIGVMSRIYRKPDQNIQPYQFGHKAAKKTCLWLKNLPLLKTTKLVDPDYVTYPSGKKLSRWYTASKENGDRDKTFTGIAKAMADQWG